MKKIYSSKSLKEAENAYNGIDLMYSAANGIISALTPHLDGNRLTIICGNGNNGGDGFAVAYLLEDYPVTVVYTGQPKTQESKYFFDKYKGEKIHAESEKAFETIKSSKIILDCIFGIGLCREPIEIYKTLIEKINESDAFVISVDVPSGINADSGKVYTHVLADKTVCITAEKLSGVITPTKEDFGEIATVNIGVNMENVPPIALVCDDEIFSFLPKRPRNSHKGTFGTLKTLCGSYNMPGAGILSITAALRCGVGLVYAFGTEKILKIFKNRLSEPVFKDFDADSFISEKGSALLIGCGIGNEYNEHLKRILTESKSCIILDADGINFLSENIDICEHISANMILTPHPAEMARLLGVSTEYVQSNRFEVCKEASEKFRCTVVLKGNGTIICTPSHTSIINSTGNSGLAKGGSGDVLSGMIASFAAQGVQPHFAAALGVYLHGAAADSLKNKFSEYCFLPSDIPLEAGRIIAEKLHL